MAAATTAVGFERRLEADLAGRRTSIQQQQQQQQLKQQRSGRGGATSAPSTQPQLNQAQRRVPPPRPTTAWHTGADPKAKAHLQQSSLRRLRYLAKWGRWQLLQCEESLPQLRATVLDEVVRPFSTWVQRIFVVSPNWSSGSCEGVRNIARHLTPLVQFLQCRASCDATLESVQDVSVAILLHGMDLQHVERCRIVFPTILETVEFYTQCIVDKQLTETAPSPRQRRRLARAVAAIRELLDRTDVAMALAGWRNGSGRTATPSATGTPLDEGLDCQDAEHEPGTPSGGSTASDEAIYYSCSDASEGEEEGKELPRRRKASSSESKASGCMQDRMRDFPRGDGEHSWCEAEAESFDVRSASYFVDRRKQPAGKPMLDLLSVDFFRIGPGGPIWRVREHRDLHPTQLRERGERRFLLILNWIFPPFQVVMVGALDPKAPWLNCSEPVAPQARAWQRFLAMPAEERQRVFKVIMAVEQGPWLVRRAVPRKPVLIGRQLKMHSSHVAGDALEITIDISSGKTEQVATGIVMHALRSLRFALATLIEGSSEDELPEALLLCASMRCVDTSRFRCPLDA
mmetsp:Transcript_37105/g.73456  ORF Transcript_37105/g.73456 Transcript_37105/m.73456 type:complete len:573 (-) Transcript_37105:65-1783(-)